MQHFLDIASLSRANIQTLIARARSYKTRKNTAVYPEESVALLFYEPSTRTRVSFEMAAKNLGMRVVLVEAERSSEQKGETQLDTILNLRAMGIRRFVIRHPNERLPYELATTINDKAISIINAGDGMHAHPSQAMLDLMTILEHKASAPNFKVAVVGNLLHSRVVSSLQWGLKIIGGNSLVMAAPKRWHPKTLFYGTLTDSVEFALKGADVVYALRVQKERMEEGDSVDLAKYVQYFQVNEARLKLAKPDAILMHPGPINRGVEMTSELIDGPTSKILEQVHNGVYMRMAILEACVNGV